MPPAFTIDQVDLAIQHVIEHGAINMATLVRYTAVFLAADMEAPQDLHRGGDG